ncbi:MAG TPA: hypothetical protein VGQ52_22035, partial [Gemmatimonadaceae bacterium]|nr:hypothetical protein [Gemmatimonadaceae bacterium]
MLMIAAAVALASSQDIAAQSDTAFPREVYSGRRAKLIRETGDAVVVVPGRLLGGTDDNSKQDP